MCCSGPGAGIGIGMLTGAFNGFFIAFLRLQPIVVTLSTMFIIQGVTLLVMDKPGGIRLADRSATSIWATPSPAGCRCLWW
jgi:ribose transport system permease protein